MNEMFDSNVRHAVEELFSDLNFQYIYTYPLKHTQFTDGTAVNTCADLLPTYTEGLIGAWRYTLFNGGYSSKDIDFLKKVILNTYFAVVVLDKLVEQAENTNQEFEKLPAALNPSAPAAIYKLVGATVGNFKGICNGGNLYLNFKSNTCVLYGVIRLDVLTDSSAGLLDFPIRVDLMFEDSGRSTRIYRFNTLCDLTFTNFKEAFKKL